MDTKVKIGLGLALLVGAGALVYKSKTILCALGGHTNMLEFGKDKLSLRCSNCGWESSGWDMKKETNS